MQTTDLVKGLTPPDRYKIYTLNSLESIKAEMYMLEIDKLLIVLGNNHIRKRHISALVFDLESSVSRTPENWKSVN